MKGYVVRKGNQHYAVIYEGLDPVTGRERRRWHPAGADRAQAEVLANELALQRMSDSPSRRPLHEVDRAGVEAVGGELLPHARDDGVDRHACHHLRHASALRSSGGARRVVDRAGVGRLGSGLDRVAGADVALEVVVHGDDEGHARLGGGRAADVCLGWPHEQHLHRGVAEDVGDLVDLQVDVDRDGRHAAERRRRRDRHVVGAVGGVHRERVTRRHPRLPVGIDQAVHPLVERSTAVRRDPVRHDRPVGISMRELDEPTCHDFLPVCRTAGGHVDVPGRGALLQPSTSAAVARTCGGPDTRAVVMQVPFHQTASSVTLVSGPTRATSSTRARGIAAAASPFRPAR